MMQHERSVVVNINKPALNWWIKYMSNTVKTRLMKKNVISLQNFARFAQHLQGLRSLRGLWKTLHTLEWNKNKKWNLLAQFLRFSLILTDQHYNLRLSIFTRKIYNIDFSIATTSSFPAVIWTILLLPRRLIFGTYFFFFFSFYSIHKLILISFVILLEQTPDLNGVVKIPSSHPSYQVCLFVSITVRRRPLPFIFG